jgi:hypothetical protein
MSSMNGEHSDSWILSFRESAEMIIPLRDVTRNNFTWACSIIREFINNQKNKLTGLWKIGNTFVTIGDRE